MTRPCAGVGQSLISHSSEVLEIAEKVFNKERKVIERKFKTISNNSNIHIENIIKLGALLHDIGKAACLYQFRFDDNCDCIHPSFELHELPSAYFAANIDNSLAKMLELNREETVLLGLVILFHLHAIRDLSKIKAKLSEKKNYKWDLSQFKSQIIEIIRKFDPNFNKDIDDLLIIKYDQLIDFIDKYENILLHVDNKNRIFKLYLLILYPILVGDNLSAKNRKQEEEQGKNREFFTKELEVLYNE